MQRVASYDSKALELLYNRYSSLLYTLIKKIVAESELAEEVLAEVFVIIWSKINYFDSALNNVYTWLITLARNKAVDKVKRLRAPENIPEYNEEYENNFIIPQLSPEIDPLDLRTVINVKDSFEIALNKLTDAQKYVIYLAYYEGLTQNEIAQKLNIPLATVKSKIKVALVNLKDNLLKEEV